jgi:hypothetical protein
VVSTLPAEVRLLPKRRPRPVRRADTLHKSAKLALTDPETALSQVYATLGGNTETVIKEVDKLIENTKAQAVAKKDQDQKELDNKAKEFLQPAIDMPEKDATAQQKVTLAQQGFDGVELQPTGTINFDFGGMTAEEAKSHLDEKKEYLKLLREAFDKRVDDKLNAKTTLVALEQEQVTADKAQKAARNAALCEARDRYNALYDTLNSDVSHLQNQQTFNFVRCLINEHGKANEEGSDKTTEHHVDQCKQDHPYEVDATTTKELSKAAFDQLWTPSGATCTAR